MRMIFPPLRERRAIDKDLSRFFQAHKNTLNANTETTYDWRHEQETVPVNGIVSKVFRIGKQPVSLALGGKYFAEAPDGGPEWGIRVVVTFLFPKQ